MQIPVYGAVSDAYPKLIGPVQLLTFNPTVGGRRAYAGVSFSEFVDNPGVNWALATPLGYTLKMRLQCDRLEANAGTDHRYKMLIGGVATAVQVDDTTQVSIQDSGMIVVSSALSGAVTFQDGTNHGESDFVGNVTVTYEFTRA